MGTSSRMILTCRIFRLRAPLPCISILWSHSPSSIPFLPNILRMVSFRKDPDLSSGFSSHPNREYAAGFAWTTPSSLQSIMASDAFENREKYLFSDNSSDLILFLMDLTICDTASVIRFISRCLEGLIGWFRFPFEISSRSSSRVSTGEKMNRESR